MNNPQAFFHLRFGWEPLPALTGALEKRVRRDVRGFLPYSLLGRVGRQWSCPRPGRQGEELAESTCPLIENAHSNRFGSGIAFGVAPSSQFVFPGKKPGHNVEMGAPENGPPFPA